MYGYSTFNSNVKNDKMGRYSLGNIFSQFWMWSSSQNNHPTLVHVGQSMRQVYEIVNRENYIRPSWYSVLPLLYYSSTRSIYWSNFRQQRFCLLLLDFGNGMSSWLEQITELHCKKEKATFDCKRTRPLKAMTTLFSSPIASQPLETYLVKICNTISESIIILSHFFSFIWSKMKVL